MRGEVCTTFSPDVQQPVPFLKQKRHEEIIVSQEEQMQMKTICNKDVNEPQMRGILAGSLFRQALSEYFSCSESLCTRGPFPRYSSLTNHRQ